MKLSIVGRTYAVDKKLLEKVAHAAFSYLNINETPGEIELKFISNNLIRSLNNAYRGIDKPTDVLSFNIDDDPLAGQIVICYTYTVREAAKRGRDINSEFSLLLVHGILHICGYDHITLEDERKMQDVEREILKTEGITR